MSSWPPYHKDVSVNKYMFSATQNLTNSEKSLLAGTALIPSPINIVMVCSDYCKQLVIPKKG